MTLLPIPLGAILVRNDVDDDRAREIDAAIRRSLAYARANEAAVMPYVREHAVEMNDDVMRAHIELYVNAFTEDLGQGRHRSGRTRSSRARTQPAYLASTERALADRLRRKRFSPPPPRLAACKLRDARRRPNRCRAARVTLGDEVFLQDAWRDLNGRSVGVIANQSGVTSRLESIVDAIRRTGRDPPAARSMRPSTAFAAIAAGRRVGRDRTSIRKAASGLQPVRRVTPAPERRDARRRRRAALRHSRRRLARLHVHFDDGLRDAEREAVHGKEFWVLDRPNPIGGDDHRRARAGACLRIVHRALSDRDAPRHDGRRTRDAVSTNASASARRFASCRCAAGIAR